VKPRQEIIHRVRIATLSPSQWDGSITPPISDGDYAALQASIRHDGIQIPLIAWKNGNGKAIIIAGNNRYKIARELKLRHVPVIFRQFDAESDAQRFAITDNLARRHLTAAQRAEIAITLQEVLKVGQGRRSDLRIGSTDVDARDAAAKQAGVSPVSMSHMRKVIASGNAELIEAVRSGRLRLASAVRLINDLKPCIQKARSPILTDEPVLSCIQGDNADLIAHVARLYLRDGSTVADVTAGRMIFWQRIDTKRWDFRPSDIAPQIKGVRRMDFRRLNYADGSIDTVVFDPPYLSRSGENAAYEHRYRASAAGKCHAEMMGIYAAGMKEAHRALKDGGLLWVKCADEVESGQFRPGHCDVLDVGRKIGFNPVDLFVLVRSTGTMHRYPAQYHSRRNHSYLWVLQKPAPMKRCHQRVIQEQHRDDHPIPEDFSTASVREIPYQQAKEFILKYEWLGNMGTTVRAFGLFFGDELAAVECFGHPGSEPIREICGKEHADKVYWMARGARTHWAHPHSSSFLVNRACRMMGQP